MDEDWADTEPLDDPLAPTSSTAEAPEPQLYYATLDDFVRDCLSPLYRRRIDGRSRVWAAEWWRYTEAIVRLEALWRSWEHLRLDPATGMSVWLRDHADHHMPILMSPDGPFAAADHTAEINQTKKGEPLPYLSPPEGLFTSD